MRAAIDFDDCVSDQTAIMLPLMNWHLGIDLKFEELEWDFFFKSPEMEKTFWQLHDLYDSSYLRRAFPPVDPYVFAVLKELQRKGHRVEIVTRNAPKSHESIRAWMWMHGVDITVHAMGRGRGDDKLRLNYDVWVDDNPTMAEAMKKHPTKRLVLFDRPWNRQVETGRNIFRARTWLEVRTILEGMGAL